MVVRVYGQVSLQEISCLTGLVARGVDLGLGDHIGDAVGLCSQQGLQRFVRLGVLLVLHIGQRQPVACSRHVLRRFGVKQGPLELRYGGLGIGFVMQLDA